MPDATLLPLLAQHLDPRRPDPPPRSAAAEQAEGARIVPAFRFVPESPLVKHDTGRLARDYARAVREGERAAEAEPDPRPGDHDD